MRSGLQVNPRSCALPGAIHGSTGAHVVPMDELEVISMREVLDINHLCLSHNTGTLLVYANIGETSSQFGPDKILMNDI